ncbi:hypothetical protein GCM10011494_31760 [Novosphingobium endophyticum]|uniref:Uncharacterized protein n=1 Tax=Novosphingobium endophyticum TaxID=1955250 RepID=A0A916X6P2_9SPHN|nr:hypothetical protein GCM10011494_31760 [Novosphingobium endophyticum]
MTRAAPSALWTLPCFLILLFAGRVKVAMKRIPVVLHCGNYRFCDPSSDSVAWGKGGVVTVQGNRVN